MSQDSVYLALPAGVGRTWASSACNRWCGGVYCLARAGLRVSALLGPGVGAFVLVSTLTGPPMMLALVFWGIWHDRRSLQGVVARQVAESSVG